MVLVETVRMNRRQILQGLATGTVVAMVPGCVENPALGRSQLMLVSESQIAQLSAQAWQQSLKRERISRDPALNAQLQRVGERVSRASGLDYDWEFVVFDSDQENAWVLPGGKVAFYRGIMETMDNDDQVATVMGHEAAHLAGRHAAERASQQQAAGIGLGLASVALDAGDVENTAQWAAILGAGVTFGVLLPYSRQHELEADRIGVDYMARAGYQPREALTFWQSKAAQKTGRPSVPEFASTHPSDETRIAALRDYLAARNYL